MSRSGKGYSARESSTAFLVVVVMVVIGHPDFSSQRFLAVSTLFRSRPASCVCVCVHPALHNILKPFGAQPFFFFSVVCVLRWPLGILAGLSCRHLRKEGSSSAVFLCRTIRNRSSSGVQYIKVTKRLYDTVQSSQKISALLFSLFTELRPDRISLLGLRLSTHMMRLRGACI